MIYVLQVLLAMFFAYLIGSFLTGIWVGKKYRGIDIRDYGSGNAGATNAMRVLGPKVGLLVLVLDILKGYLPVILLPIILSIDRPVPSTVELLIGGSAVAGHMFSFLAGFRGGKGVATAIGAFLAMAPEVMLIVVCIALILLAVSGWVSLGSVVAAMFVPYLLWWKEYPWPVIAVASLLCAFVIVRHQGNILRMLSGSESRVWDSFDGDAESETEESADAGTDAEPKVDLSKPRPNDPATW